MVHHTLAAAAKLQEKGINIEVIDPRTLVPLDKQSIIDSVKKTSKLVIINQPESAILGTGGITDRVVVR